MANPLDTTTPLRGEDLTGRTFNYLTVLSFAGWHFPPCRRHDKFWLCRCSCGNLTTVKQGHLKSNDTKSCGCFRALFTHRRPVVVHGLCRHPLYGLWEGMKSRCSYPRHIAFKDYGGRGIQVLEPWRSSFQSFYDDMASSWKPGLTLDRKDVNGPYCKDNCRWATHIEQGNNRRNNIRIEFRGETHTISEWSRIFPHLYKQTIIDRIRRGWTIEETFTEPLCNNGKNAAKRATQSLNLAHA